MKLWAYGDFGCCPPNVLATTKELLFDVLGYETDSIEEVEVIGFKEEICDCEGKCHSGCEMTVEHRYCESCFQALSNEIYEMGQEKQKDKVPRCPKCWSSTVQVLYNAANSRWYMSCRCCVNIGDLETSIMKAVEQWIEK